MWRQTIAFLGVVLVGSLWLSPLLPAEEPAAKELLPGNALWVRHVHTKQTGERNTDLWKILVKNHKVTGYAADESARDKKERAMCSGEVIDGTPPIIYLRQDNSNIKGYSTVLCGQRVAGDRIVGVWFDTVGQSGDFELVLQHK